VTPWAVVNVETIHTGEELVTLKARQSIGVLPRLRLDQVPESARSNIIEKLEALENDFQRAGVESVVDRSREAASAILSAYLQKGGDEGAKGKDLGPLVKRLSDSSSPNGNRVLACAAEIPQRLHSRAKHAEQEKRGTIHPIREQDAELAVLCVGTMLRDMGWADW